MSTSEPMPTTHPGDDAIALTTIQRPEEPDQQCETHETNGFCAPGLDKVTLVKRRRTWSYLPGLRFEHNLHWAAGLLELANSGDFAANIWNDVPVPVYAIVFMAIGGTVAGLVSFLALQDSARAWHNVKFLRKQRRELTSHRAQQMDERQSTQELNVLLDVTKRELYNEVINRWGMDLLMGGGAVLISIGTFMAIGGADPKVFMASNILSGYLGNAPIALFGLVNFVWGMYMWSTKHGHSRAAKAKLQEPAALSRVRKYCFDLQLFFAVNGISTLIGGVGSMLTATQWWAYVMLIPVIICSYFCNYWWRTRTGYDRPWLDFPIEMDTQSLVQALEFSEETGRLIVKHPEAAIAQLVPDPTSLPMVLDKFVEHGLFDAFSVRLVKNASIRTALGGETATTVDIEASKLLDLSEEYQVVILDMAGKFLRNHGPKHFEHRTRFLAEVLSTYLAKVHTETLSQDEEREKDAERTDSPQRPVPE